MKIDKDGKVNSFDRETLEVMNEFSFDMEAMADEIIELRDKLGRMSDQLDDALSGQD